MEEKKMPGMTGKRCEHLWSVSSKKKNYVVAVVDPASVDDERS